MGMVRDVRHRTPAARLVCIQQRARRPIRIGDLHGHADACRRHRADLSRVSGALMERLLLAAKRIVLRRCGNSCLLQSHPGGRSVYAVSRRCDGGSRGAAHRRWCAVASSCRVEWVVAAASSRSWSASLLRRACRSTRCGFWVYSLPSISRFKGASAFMSGLMLKSAL
jgi:hypothetical protein